MKKIVFTLFASVLLMSCTQNKEYVIYGTVASPDLEGAKVYLVPIEDVTKENLDSTYIHNQFFEFRGTEERVVDIRLQKSKRLGVETLLVVTEPGEIYVTLGRSSTGRGTPQNDTIQAWKHLTHSFYRRQIDREYYFSRTMEMAKNIGENSTLGSFLISSIPEDSK